MRMNMIVNWLVAETIYGNVAIQVDNRCYQKKHGHMYVLL